MFLNIYKWFFIKYIKCDLTKKRRDKMWQLNYVICYYYLLKILIDFSEKKN
jgi:uncharacterized protein YpiB (UPF0302 family)